MQSNLHVDSVHSPLYQIQQNIVTGAWGCTEAQSMKLAAHQVQVEFGNYNPAKHKPGFLEYEVQSIQSEPHNLLLFLLLY